MTGTERLLWYMRRLAAMSPQEILTRASMAATKLRWRRRKSWSSPPPSLSSEVRPWLDPDELEVEARVEIDSLLDEAESMMAGRVRLLNVDFGTVTTNWHQDPLSRKVSPHQFAFDVPYRDADRCGDIKNIWELNRHQHLARLALAFSVTRDPLYSNEIERQLVSWTVQNPILVGVNWYSGLELALRLDSWVWIERLLRGSDAHRSLFSTSGVLWQPIYWHQRIIHQTLSPGSSSNNHLIGELTGLFVAASAWPVFPESEHWAEDARDRLETEIDRQTYASGLNRELAFSYHLFVLELFLTAAIEGRRSGRDFSPAYLNRLRDMRDTIVALADKRGNLPRFGDEDGGTALALLAPQADHARTLLDLSERFLLGTEWQSRGLERRLIDQVMLGALPASARVSTAVEQDRDFSDAGVYTLSSERGTEEEILVIADAGPLGYLSIAAHGHADALSFTLNAGGHPVLVDPGTYTYFGDADARNYFRSTAAHNTIVVDGLDQSESGGPFIWTKKASTRVLEWRRDEAGATLLAEHDGYKRLAGEVTHRRRLDLIDNTLTVEDRLDGRGSHEIEWRLHFHPSCVVTVEDGVCLASWEHGGLTFRCDPRLDWRLASGEADAGWYSSAFNERSTSTTLIGSSSVDLPFELSHALCVSFCH